MARKGQFKKGGGRVGGTRTISGSKSRRTTAIVVVPSQRRPTHRRKHAVHHKAKHRRRHGSGGGGVSVGKLAGAALVLANVAGTNSGPLGDKVYNLVQKIPGSKTFGGAAVAGVAIGAVGKFTGIGGRFRPWMRAAGIVGIIAAFLKLGEQGTAFKWVGDDDVMDVET